MDNYFEELKTELRAGAENREHSFHYFVLGTEGVDHMVRQRIIVLRNFGDDLKLSFFTDYRSKKVTHIRENNRVSLLFYDPANLLQLRIEGLASISRDRAVIESHWENLEDPNRKAYTTATAPGTVLENPEVLEFLDKDNYFCLVDVEPFKIEYLKLAAPNHLRVHYKKKGDHWEGSFLTP